MHLLSFLKCEKRILMRNPIRFFDVYLDPLNDYKISYFYPKAIPVQIQDIVKLYFGYKTYMEEKEAL